MLAVGCDAGRSAKDCWRTWLTGNGGGGAGASAERPERGSLKNGLEESPAINREVAKANRATPRRFFAEEFNLARAKCVGATSGTGRDGGVLPTCEDRQFAMCSSPGPPSRATLWLGRASARIFVNEPLRKPAMGGQPTKLVGCDSGNTLRTRSISCRAACSVFGPLCASRMAFLLLPWLSLVDVGGPESTVGYNPNGIRGQGCRAGSAGARHFAFWLTRFPTLAWSLVRRSAEFFNRRWLDYAGLPAGRGIGLGLDCVASTEDSG